MRNIRASRQYEHLVKELGPELFKTQREFVCFSALLGYEKSVRDKVGEDHFDAVDARNFENGEVSLEILYSIGVASSNGIDILREENEEKLISEFEQYLAGGLSLLANLLAHHTNVNVQIDEIINDTIFNHRIFKDYSVPTEIRDLDLTS